MKTGLRVWDCAYDQYRQIIADEDKIALYERRRTTDTHHIPEGEVNVAITRWTMWRKLEEPQRMDKAWFRRELTVEDLILDNFTKETE